MACDDQNQEPVVEPVVVPVVEMIRATKLYPANGDTVEAVPAVRDVSLVLPKGSFTAIVGRSGCGKSTLLNLAGAVDLPSSGDVRIERRSTREMNDNELSRLRRTRIGFVFQFFNLLPTLTVMENVELPLLLDRQARSHDERAALRQRIAELLDLVGVADKAAQFPHQLSGGQMQRVAIARALAPTPALVVADEPTGNLDSSTAETVLALLQRVSRQMGHTVLMATHSKEAADAASRVIHMRDGCLADS